MKKFLLTFVIMILLLSGVHAYASQDREHGIAEFIIHIHINADGSADVEERITNRFIGQFNGVFRDINRRGIGRIENFQAWEYIPATGEYIPFTEVRRASIGDDKVYTVSNESGISNYQLFSPSLDEYRTFVYSYTMTRVAARFLDAGQVNHYVIGSEWVVPIESYEIKITFEEAPPISGELTATVYIGGSPHWEFVSATNDISFNSYNTHLNPGQTLRVDAIFPTTWILDAPIINRNIDDQPFPVWIIVVLSIVGLILLVIIIISILARPHKVDFNERYYDKLPADNGPALMAYLVNDRTIKIKDMIATLLNMTKNGVLSISTDDTGDYVFTRNPGFTCVLKSHEDFLIQWLFEDIGDGTTLELQIVRQIGKTEDTALLFHEKFNEWIKFIEKEAEHLQYYDSIWRRSPHGELEYRKWLAFKRYLKNLTNIEQTDINTHEFWDKFLPYALSLGSTKKLIKKLPNIPMPIADDLSDAGSVLWFNIISPQLINVCNNAFADTYSQAQVYAASSSDGSVTSIVSSASGGGGGGAF